MEEPTKLRIIRVVMAIYFFAFVIVGATMVLAPDGLLSGLNLVGSRLGGFVEHPPTGGHFWVSLAFAYMTCVAGLAWFTWRDPRAYRPMFLVLGAGKTASSLTCLVYFLFGHRVFVYLLNFLTDFPIVLVAFGFYAWLAPREPKA